MYAVAMISGRQFWIEEGKYYDLNCINLPKNTEIQLNRILLVNDGKKLLIGQPFLESSTIKATVLKQLKGPKIFVYKKKRKKKYKKMMGHRQSLTRIKITSIES